MAATKRSGGGESGSDTDASEKLKRLERLTADDVIALACEARGARARAAENWRRGMRGASRIDWPLGMFEDAARGNEVDVFQFNHPGACPDATGEADDCIEGGSGTSSGMNVSSLSSSSSKYRSGGMQHVWLCDLHPLAFSRVESDASSAAARTAAGSGSDSGSDSMRDVALEKQILALQGSITQLAARSEEGGISSASGREAAVTDLAAHDAGQRPTPAPPPIITAPTPSRADGGLFNFASQCMWSDTLTPDQKETARVLRSIVRGKHASVTQESANAAFKSYLKLGEHTSWKQVDVAFYGLALQDMKEDLGL